MICEFRSNPEGDGVQDVDNSASAAGRIRNIVSLLMDDYLKCFSHCLTASSKSSSSMICPFSVHVITVHAVTLESCLMSAVTMFHPAAGHSLTPTFLPCFPPESFCDSIFIVLKIGL
jgi:hypothetical protein